MHQLKIVVVSAKAVITSQLSYVLS